MNMNMNSYSSRQNRVQFANDQILNKAEISNEKFPDPAEILSKKKTQVSTRREEDRNNNNNGPSTSRAEKYKAIGDDEDAIFYAKKQVIRKTGRGIFKLKINQSCFPVRRRRV
jgi:hypothetical protein